MGKQNYRDAIEKDRQEVSVLGNAAASRIAQRKAVKEKPKKTKSALLTTLFFLFILIPVSILIYVAFFYEPNDTLTANPSSDQVSLESPIPDAPLVPVVTEEEDSEESAAAEKAAEEKEEAAEKEATEKEAADKLAQQEAEKTAAAKEQAQKEQAEKEAAQAEAEKERQRAEAERQKEQAAAEQKKQETPAAPVAASKTHTVQSGETLYRIAVNTYGSAGASAGVEKIKAANGLNSNEITVGSTLVLP
ncbi:LysM peptidoglycan-binding domain-containing protein [Planococcus sp. APC 3906]|uniref:LysM peptidoglycan-binding domain-containing protein n=1 Tax=Planococcus TaxID=1372 RepID=UPI0025B5628E|nr:LysM peptidoglycan-binding domain-containing protein [Planococcus sp. APC 3906]MDN3450421.1 LysM peptidoglycan-binding domain-containing protein [Planococcus sp. APC 3906]